ncbi:MAG: YceD family protein [Gammaproteobacteria bacterium]|nr:YceD family protein [Gammaproteobacteria bacterium]
MSTGLPAQIDPLRLADIQARLNGEIPLERMHRLTGHQKTEGIAGFDVVFEKEARGRVVMRGEIWAESVPTVCQRCLEPMFCSIWSEFELEFAAGDVALDEEEIQDIIVVEKPVQLQGLIEDELLLAMPMVPMHEPECSASQFLGQALPEPQVQARTTEKSRENPFAVLAKLKLDDGKQNDK